MLSTPDFSAIPSFNWSRTNIGAKLTGTACFPTSRQQAASWANKLKKAGYRVVGLHHLDIPVQDWGYSLDRVVWLLEACAMRGIAGMTEFRSQKPWTEAYVRELAQLPNIAAASPSNEDSSDDFEAKMDFLRGIGFPGKLFGSNALVQGGSFGDLADCHVYGASGRFIGKLYTYISPSGLATGTFGYSYSALGSNNTVIPSVSSQTEMQAGWTQEYLLSSWRPLDSTDLKFSVAIARYFHNGVPVQSNNDILNDMSLWIWGSYNSVTPIGNNRLRVSVPANPTEFITYDRTDSIGNPTSFGEVVYQDRPYWTGGKNTYCTCATTNGTSIILANNSYVLANGSTFKWSHVFSTDLAQDQYIVVTSLNHDGSGAHRVNVRRVIGVSNNRLGVTEPLTFTNATVRFFVAPVGRISSKLKAFGTLGKMNDMIVLSDSNANDLCRCVNNTITL